MNYAALLHGEPLEVLQQLDNGEPDLLGLSMAVCNAFRRIQYLEQDAKRVRDAISNASTAKPEAV